MGLLSWRRAVSTPPHYISTNTPRPIPSPRPWRRKLEAQEAKLAAQIQALTVGMLPAMIDGWIRFQTMIQPSAIRFVQFGEVLYEWADSGSRLGGSGRL